MPAITVAVVIPTFNEADSIRAQIPSLTGRADEIVVTDGGSTDATVRVAEELGARCVIGSRGRGPQMNRGANKTRSDVLLFLHADTRLPADALEEIRNEVERGHVGGGFLARFDDQRPLLRLGSRLINLRTHVTQTPLGDQAQFVTREAFEQLEGFRQWPILEDLDFMRRLRRHGRVAIIEQAVETSARRYVQDGISRTIFNNWLIWILFFLGVSPDRLAERYRDVR